MKIEVGARIKKIPVIFEALHEDSEAFNAVKDLEGTIVYVHPEHRYFTVEYEFKNGRKFPESFKITRKPGVGGSKRVVLDNGRR